MSDSSATRPGPSDALWTLPNAICAARIALSPLLVILALRDQRLALLIAYIALTASDWLDGKLAILLDQRSRIGPRLDTIADLVMYASLGVAVLILDGDRLVPEWPWWTTALLTYLIAGAASLAKFRRWPTYHTGLAKVSWFLVLIGASLFVLAPSDWLRLGSEAAGIWPLRLALVTVTLGNLQSLAITRVLPHWASDVRTVADARRIRDTDS